MQPNVVSTNSGNAVAMAAMIFLNWILAHAVNDWVMPPEVMGAGQLLLSAGAGEVIASRRNKVINSANATAQRVLAAPDPRVAAAVAVADPGAPAQAAPSSPTA